MYRDDYGYEDYLSLRFREPGGNSALHPGERIHPCPTCERPNRLTAQDKKKGYQCDDCADALERGYDF